ncbi:glycosyl hydrolase [Glutamicibacter protophormiae]|uniref:glycosyl hydrolase n=1 Tax=Glutamicibacter protophormiae TaxID=37930 RepID=UPI003A8E7D24
MPHPTFPRTFQIGAAALAAALSLAALPPAQAAVPPQGCSGRADPGSCRTVVGWAAAQLGDVPGDEAELGASNGMLSTYVDFANHPGFPADYAAEAARRDAALLIAWEPYDWENRSVDQPDYRPAAIADGRYDTYLVSWLRQAQEHAADQPVLVRFAPEMNDAIRPWSVGVNGGNTAADYVRMFRHVYELKQRWAPDAAMVWNPLVAGSTPDGTPVDFASVYPGADYVDVLALDGFNWADANDPAVNCNWQSYDDVFGAPVAQLKELAGGKPWGIAEVASASRGESFFTGSGECAEAWGSWVFHWPQSPPFYAEAEDWITQAGWVETMMLQAHADGALFVNLFNMDKETDWRLESTPAGTEVLGRMDATGSFSFGHEGSSQLIHDALRAEAAAP